MSEVQMRGLTNFIGEIRKCKTKEAELKRIEKELANIRKHFSSTKKMDAYQKKKYTYKLLYIHLLGYDVDIGHMEALQMITAATYTEKNVGYLACSVLLNETSDLLRLTIQAIKNDLSGKNEAFQCLALNTVANVGGQEFAESLTSDVQNLLTSNNASLFVKKKAALALLRLFRKFPEAIPTDNFASKVLAILDDNNLGVLVSVCALILGLISHDPRGYEDVVNKAARILTMLVITYYVNPRDPRHHPQIDQRHRPYSYWHTMCPWLQIKLLRILQYFPPSTDPSVAKRINDVLQHIMTHTDVTKNVSKNNADHAILFEALNTTIHYCVHGQTHLQKAAVDIIARFITVKEPNIRYLGLDTMARLAALPGTLAMEGFKDQKRFDSVKSSLNDPDISIRKRALDLMYALCERENAEEIVQVMVEYLNDAEYEIKDELVLKIAILAEKFAKDLRWYIDTILKLINLAGDFVSEDIWYRVVQIVTNHEEVQEYAASTVLKALHDSSIHESGIKVGGYILGEFGHSITDQSVTGGMIFKVLYERFHTASLETKALLLSSFMKMANTYPEVKPKVEEVFASHKAYVDPEIQQRSLEYSALNASENESLMNTVFEIMPNFPERESALLKRIRKAKKNTTDRDVFTGAEAPGMKKGTGDDDDDDSDSDSGSSDSDSDDDYDDDDEKKSSTKRAPPARQSSEGQLERKSAEPIDLLGFDMGTSTPAETSGEVSPFDAQPDASPYNLFGTSQGVLYESNGFVVGVRWTTAASQCKMILSYENKTTSTMTNVLLEVPNAGNLKAQVRPTTPLTVEVGGKTLQYLLWHCLSVFHEVPSVAVAFNHGGAPVRVSLRLPVFPANFLSPLDMQGGDFVERWKVLKSSSIKVIKGTRNIDLDSFKAAVRDKLTLRIFEGLEPNANNFSAAGAFTTTSGVQPSLMRLETKPGTAFIRLSVHGSSDEVCEASTNALENMLQYY